MRLAPREVQPNNLFTRRGSVASQTDISTDWATVQKRADRRRRDDRRMRVRDRCFLDDVNVFTWGVCVSISEAMTERTWEPSLGAA